MGKHETNRYGGRMKVEIKRYKSGERAGDIRKNVVEVDAEDCWSLDWTLAQIIAPSLKKLKEAKHGVPSVLDEDVPAELRCSPEVDKDEINWEWKDENYFKRWDYVLSEMIWAMEEIASERPNEPGMFRRVGEMEFGEIGEDGLGTLKTRIEIIPEMQEVNKAYHVRIQNGCRLFGTYYTSLWS